MDYVVLASSVGAIVYILVVGFLGERQHSLRIKARVRALIVWMLAIALWPILWSVLLGENRKKLVTLPSLVWPILILSLDIFSMQTHTYESQLKSKRSILSMDSNAICSLTFALSSLIGAQRNKCCKNLFLFAIMGCVAFVMPSLYKEDNSIDTFVIEAVQKAILAYATGLLLAGVLLVVGGDANSDPDKPALVPTTEGAPPAAAEAAAAE